MAFELQIAVALVDTAREAPGNAGVLIRGQRASTLMFDHGGTASDVFVLAGARLEAIADEVLTDVKGQLEIAARNGKAIE